MFLKGNMLIFPSDKSTGLLKDDWHYWSVPASAC